MNVIGEITMPVKRWWRLLHKTVIFELGYFIGQLGRGRACLLRKGEVEIPSDLYGVIYTDLDTAGGWKLKLLKELKAAKIPFNEAKVVNA